MDASFFSELEICFLYSQPSGTLMGQIKAEKKVDALKQRPDGFIFILGLLNGRSKGCAFG